MNIIETKKSIRKLNKPQFGSFGEYIFAHYVTKTLRKGLVKTHKDSSDFEYQGKKIDIGARRKLQKHFSFETIKNKDVFVFLYKDFCFLSYPKNFEIKLSWNRIASLFSSWAKNHNLDLPTNSEVSFIKEYGEIEKFVSSFFSDNGCQSEIIYRTVSNKFGLRESPHNLLTKGIKKDRIRVYIDFNSHIKTIENINFIIAFPENAQKEIPRQKKVSIKSGKSDSQKIDLKTIKATKHRCYFENLEELKDHFFKRY